MKEMKRDAGTTILSKAKKRHNLWKNENKYPTLHFVEAWDRNPLLKVQTVIPAFTFGIPKVIV